MTMVILNRCNTCFSFFIFKEFRGLAQDVCLKLGVLNLDWTGSKVEHSSKES